MLAKCTNPACSASFHHLAEGRLFRLETDPTLGLSQARQPEYFWLCEHCSKGMTLRLEQDGKVMATGLREVLRNGPQIAFASVNRANGVLLRSVSFLRRSTSREACDSPTDKGTMPHDWKQHDGIVAAASNCPMADCGSLVIEYKAASSVRPGHPEDWGFTCSRCGIEFTGDQGELIFQCVPRQWLAA